MKQLLYERELLYNEVSKLKAECEALKSALAVEEKIIRQWILARVTIDVIPADEGNEEEFIKNLLNLLNEDETDA